MRRKLPNLDVSLLFMNLGLETGDAETETSHTRYLQTFGTYVTYQPESGNWLPVQAAFYYQPERTRMRRVYLPLWQA